MQHDRRDVILYGLPSPTALFDHCNALQAPQRLLRAIDQFLQQGYEVGDDLRHGFRLK